MDPWMSIIQVSVIWNPSSYFLMMFTVRVNWRFFVKKLRERISIRRHAVTVVKMWRVRCVEMRIVLRCVVMRILLWRIVMQRIFAIIYHRLLRIEVWLKYLKKVFRSGLRLTKFYYHKFISKWRNIAIWQHSTTFPSFPDNLLHIIILNYRSIK